MNVNLFFLLPPGTLCPSHLHGEAAVVRKRIGKRMLGRKMKRRVPLGGWGEERRVRDEGPAWLERT